MMLRHPVWSKFLF